MESFWALVPPHSWLPPSDHAAASLEAPGPLPGERIRAASTGRSKRGGRRLGVNGEAAEWQLWHSPGGEPRAAEMCRLLVASPSNIQWLSVVPEATCVVLCQLLLGGILNDVIGELSVNGGVEEQRIALRAPAPRPQPASDHLRIGMNLNENKAHLAVAAEQPADPISVSVESWVRTVLREVGAEGHQEAILPDRPAPAACRRRRPRCR